MAFSSTLGAASGIMFLMVVMGSLSRYLVGSVNCEGRLWLWAVSVGSGGGKDRLVLTSGPSEIPTST